MPASVDRFLDPSQSPSGRTQALATTGEMTTVRPGGVRPMPEWEVDPAH